METRPGPLLRYAIPLQLFVIVVYVWYFTTGLWTSLPKTFSTSLYDQLASAFRGGHLYLDRQPAADLLTLSDPYVVQERKQVSSYIGDATLYKGRYYLYWGPVPAVILAAIKSTIYSGRIGDEYLALLFLSSLFASLSTLMLMIWRRFFGGLPRWSVLAGIPVIGLITPFTWMLNHPLVYEAALASAQFFFVGGLYWSYAALAGATISFRRLALASLSWGLGIGSQFTQIVPVLFVVLLTLWWVHRKDRESRISAGLPRAAGALLAPIVVALLGLAYYNWARFGSVLEFGYRYQLAVVNLHEHYDEIFSPLYVVPNAYNYALNPFQMIQGFPFIVPQYGKTFSDSRLGIPRIYYTEAITGALYTAPFLLYALIPMGAQLNELRRKGLKAWLSDIALDAFDWLRWSLIGTATLEIGILLLFFYSAPRYLLALTPALLLLAVIGFWESYQWLAKKGWALRFHCLVAFTLACHSILVSSLLAVSSSQDRFLDGNPALIQQINTLFGH